MVHEKFRQEHGEPQAIFLDAGGGWGNGENLFTVFTNPVFSLSFKNGTAYLKEGECERKIDGNPLNILEDYFNRNYFAIGYIGYEFFDFLESRFAPDYSKSGNSFPDAFFLFFENYEEGKISQYQDRFREGNISQVEVRPNSNMAKEDYLEMVRRAQTYIKQGDIYQVNLSQRFDFPFRSSPVDFFFRLYEKQPVPFSCYLSFGEFNLISGSMELFLRKSGRRLVTRPIKGTRPRGSTSEEDKSLMRELIQSEKERAENVMIVDLMRNDLGRICEFGSVKVNNLLEIETYSTLHQMVSEVEGELREDVTVKEILEATFPPGSVTGAPKIRSMEIIDELEPHLRGPYCGTIGIFKPSGDFTLSVAIRVVTIKQNEANFWTGGGIVGDSVPEQEYGETLTKARATKKSLGDR